MHEKWVVGWLVGWLGSVVQGLTWEMWNTPWIHKEEGKVSLIVAAGLITLQMGNGPMNWEPVCMRCSGEGWFWWITRQIVLDIVVLEHGVSWQILRCLRWCWMDRTTISSPWDGNKGGK